MVKRESTVTLLPAEGANEISFQCTVHPIIRTIKPVVRVTMKASGML